ncbi:MAG: tryptophan-rich sensory protein [Patescibacteria group bacterium]|jgi:benzodiazapine receptor
MRLHYIIIPLITLLTATLGGNVTTKGMEWYKTINLPSWTPPGSLIGMVWTTIFILATISAIIFWNKSPRNNRFLITVLIFLINAVLNFGWSYLFFGLHKLNLAILESVLLGTSVFVLLFLIWPVSRLASILLLPYGLWVTFATYLTYVVSSLNK